MRQDIFAVAMAVWLLSVVGATYSVADPEVVVRVEYYDLTGNTAADLRGQLNKKGIEWTDGNTYDAYTSWYVRWNFNYVPSPAGCAIISVRTSVEVVHTMPRWKDRDGAAAALTRKWDKYIKSLQSHEEGHAKLGIAAAEEIESAIATMSPYPDCESLENAANIIGYEIIDKYRRLEKRFDTRTQYGRMQGATFP